MKVQHLQIAFEDARGVIADLLPGEEIQKVAFMTTKAGYSRGDHYHVISHAHVFVCSGAFEVRARAEAGPVLEFTATVGDLVTFEPGERHVLHAIADSAFLMFRTGPPDWDGYTVDTIPEPV